MIFVAALLAISASGCSTTNPRWVDQPWTPVTFQQNSSSDAIPTTDATNQFQAGSFGRALPAGQTDPNTQKKPAIAQVQYQQTVRAQDGGYPLNGNAVPPGQTTNPATTPQTGQYVPPNPQQAAPGRYPLYPMRPAQVPTPPVGDPNEVPPYFQPQNPPNSNATVPTNFADIDVLLRETQTGRMTFGAAFNSNSGLVGQIIIDERNFDIWGFPRSFQDIVNGTAWRGRGQGFRLELVPGNDVQRYLVSFTEPYLFNSQVSFNASGYYYDRRYFDWNEQRLGGRFALGYRLTPDLSVSVGTRLENVNVYDPRVLSSAELNSALGDNSLFLGQVSLINDTRDHPFMASDGSYLEMSFYQGFGSNSYPRGDIDYRRYFLIYQRPDASGRHTLSMGTRAGFSGPDTPIYENYFAGGFSTLRGFDFRGASPAQSGVRVGGEFQWLNTVEYTFPITADDMIKGVLFCDFGTVEESIRLSADNFRVAPGFGFRVHMPVGGAGGAPLAFDFAFPVADAATDDRQIFSFYMGALR